MMKSHAFCFYWLFALLAMCLMLSACHPSKTEAEQSQMLFADDKYPHAVFYQGNYYYTSQPTSDTLCLRVAAQIEELGRAPLMPVWFPDSGQTFFHVWSPELHRIQDKWYIYFEADDGNMDNHHLYVLENKASDPLQGRWQMKGVLHTNDEWNYGLHPTVLNLKGGLYLLWSGWPKRRTETETQCIYIAQLDNPWTVGSERVMLSRPEYEWELQWINPNGNRLAYPIYVNENPEAFVTPDGRHVCVCYSASGIWTIYHALGMLVAPATSDLLDPESWTKSPEPLFTRGEQETSLCGTSNICLITDASTSRLVISADGTQTPLLFEGLWTDDSESEHRSVFLGSVRWTEAGLPDFGHPAPYH